MMVEEGRKFRGVQIIKKVFECQGLGGNKIYYSYLNEISSSIKSCLCVFECKDIIIILKCDNINNGNCIARKTIASVWEFFPDDDVKVGSEQFTYLFNLNITTIPPNPITTTTIPLPFKSITTTTTISITTTINTVPPPEDISSSTTTTNFTTILMFLSLLLLMIVNY